jgi:hypothetical protein
VGHARIDRRFTHLDERIDGIQRSINRFGAAVVLTFLTALLGLFFGHGYATARGRALGSESG